MLYKNFISVCCKFIAIIFLFTFSFFVNAKSAGYNEAALKSLINFLGPGTGQIFFGDPIGGWTTFGVYLYGSYAYYTATQEPDFIESDVRINEKKYEIYINEPVADSEFYGQIAGTSLMYSFYATYRDVLLGKNNSNNKTNYYRGDRFNSFQELSWAMFNPRILTDYYVWIPLAILTTSALTDDSKIENHVRDKRYVYTFQDGFTRDEYYKYGVGTSYLTGIGEETLFRGFLNHYAIQKAGVYPGIAISATIFGVAHAGAGFQATSLQAFLFGVYMGFVHHKKNYDLRHVTALHSWWNTIVMVYQASIGKDANINFQIPF